MRASLSWRRVLATVGVMGAVVAGVSGTPFAMDAYADWRAAKAAEPRPIVATDAEQGAIARAILDSGAFRLPPPPGSSVPRERAWVLDRTASMRDCDIEPGKVIFCPPSDYASAELLDDELYPGLPRRWRLELIAANQVERNVPNPGYADTTWVSADAARSVQSQPQWDALRARRPDVSGFLQLSRAALSPDRREAIVLALHYWPIVFESPSHRVFHLVRTPEGWRVATRHIAGVPPQSVEFATPPR